VPAPLSAAPSPRAATADASKLIDTPAAAVPGEIQPLAGQPAHRPLRTVSEPELPSAAGVTPLAAAPVAVTVAAPVEGPAAPRTITDVQQPLVASLTRLRGRDGTHELTVQLHPAELGAVNVNASIRNGALTVTVACADQSAHAAVAAALPNLQHELQSAGFTGVDVSLGQRSPNPDAAHTRPAQGAPGEPAPRDHEQPPTDRRRSRSAAGLDRWL
jgi:flagellar hook-length control protein FliK